MEHLAWHTGEISRNDRNLLNGHKSGILCFTGLSGACKSTLAHELEKVLYRRGMRFPAEEAASPLCI